MAKPEVMHAHIDSLRFSRARHAPLPPLGVRRLFSSASRSQRKHVDHYAILSVPKNATRAQIKTRYYQLSKQHHPDVAKDHASRTKFHAASEAYSILGDDRKRREYDRTLTTSLQTPCPPRQHPQATTTRPSQQPGFKHFWPNHPRNRTRDPMGNAAQHDNQYERARTGNYNNAYHRHPQSRSQTSYTGPDPSSSPFVRRATGHRPTWYGATSESSNTPPNVQQGGFHSAGSTPWTASSVEARRTPAADGRPTQDEASGTMRAVGASGLVGAIMLVAAIVGHSKRTS